jgi:hypothetical protein
MATKVNIDQLRKADIIVSTTDAAVSKAIKFGIGADFSHSMLYIGNGFVIEAIADGVVQRTWKEASSDATLAIALRRRYMDDAKRDAVVNHAKGFVNPASPVPYDGVGAAGAGITKKRGGAMYSGLTGAGFSINPVGTMVAKYLAERAIRENAGDEKKDTAFFCSELVARAYQLAGMALSDTVEPSYTNPREIRMSTKLMYIGHLIN